VRRRAPPPGNVTAREMEPMMKRALIGSLAFAILISLGPACGSSRTLVVYSDRQGPPPHAPAHGYRCKHRHAHRDVELVYDSRIQVYTVVGYPDHFFIDNYYYRVTKGGWYTATAISGPWIGTTIERIPVGLKKSKGVPGNSQGSKSNDQGKSQGKSKGKGNKKH
jgi:hypothetical protein